MASPGDTRSSENPISTSETEEATEASRVIAQLEARVASLEQRTLQTKPREEPHVEKKKDSSPLLLTILGAIATGLFAIWNSFIQARNAHQLEQDKLQSTIVLKAIEPSDPEERKKALLFYVEVGLLADPEGKIAKLKPENIPQSTSGTRLKTIGVSDILQFGEAIVFSSGMMVNPDGAPRAYHPDGRSGLDSLANAGKPGNWWALITDSGQSSGNPVIQGPNDPAPGFYISFTSLQDTSKERTDPRRYVDSSQIPYITIPSRFTTDTGVKLGDIAAVYCEEKQKVEFAVVADTGPRNKIGEGSIALATSLGLPSDPKKAGTDKGVTYVVFPQSGKNWPMTAQEIQQTGQKLFGDWGGVKRIKSANNSPSPSSQP